MAASEMGPPPPPPKVSLGVQLQECIEGLVEFSLISSTRGKILCGLSDAYCANLLRADPSNPLPSDDEHFRGIPSYPLYKRVARSLCQSIYSGAFCVSNEELTSVHDDLSVKRKQDEWNKLIVEKSAALIKMVKEVDFELHVHEPFFSQLSDGLKTVEGRSAVGDYRRIKPGDMILLNKCVMLQVQDVHQYASFHDMLEAENLQEVLPGVKSIEEGVKIYRAFYSEEKESSNGVLAICVRIPTSQPYLTVASILQGLNYEGIQRSLGFVHTVGTVTELLPPPPSTLLSTFLEQHNPHVKSATLTAGARALAKHANRSNKGYWGTLCGNDSDKNSHSLDVISFLLTHCTWLNIHIVPPHGIVLEIRVAEGYGARWSQDGSKVYNVM
ncbi:hypothetical protein F511_00711 [Dorcoceras hygrometricum]|nr:hypothetical protein F511_00711 [Dorcoceras hygrometricum]